MKAENTSQNDSVNVDNLRSDRKGFSGFAEGLLRRFRSIAHAAMLLPLYTLGCAIVGTAALPGIMLMRWLWHQSSVLPASSILKWWMLGFGVAAAYLLYGFSIIFVSPIINRVLNCNLKPWRGPYYSLPAIRWYIHNGATYIVRYSFLEFITPTPFNLLFFQLMGMKIGRNTIINTTHISDPSLISIGRNATIGGSVTIVGHYGQGGYLILAPVTIGDKATIGLKATIMGGAQIGHGAKIMPNSVVLPKTVVPDGETWGGVPAVRLSVEDYIQKKSA